MLSPRINRVVGQIFLLFVLFLIGNHLFAQQTWDTTIKSSSLQQPTNQQMMLNKPDKAGVTVSDKEVERHLDNRMHYLKNLYGSKKKLEQATGKNYNQIKEEFREPVREQVIAEKMQEKEKTLPQK